MKTFSKEDIDAVRKEEIYQDLQDMDWELRNKILEYLEEFSADDIKLVDDRIRVDKEDPTKFWIKF